jgi:hypothetical protein
MNRLAHFLSIGALLLAAPASAHDAKGRHGGRVVSAGQYHLELVIGSGQIAVFMLDHSDRLVPARGFKGAAILTAGGRAHRIALESGDGGELAGKTDVALPPDVKGVVQLTGPDGKTVQGQFK